VLGTCWLPAANTPNQPSAGVRMRLVLLPFTIAADDLTAVMAKSGDVAGHMNR
jgi:hypothetical protein